MCATPLLYNPNAIISGHLVSLCRGVPVAVCVGYLCYAVSVHLRGGLRYLDAYLVFCGQAHGLNPCSCLGSFGSYDSRSTVRQNGCHLQRVVPYALLLVSAVFGEVHVRHILTYIAVHRGIHGIINRVTGFVTCSDGEDFSGVGCADSCSAY